MRGEFSRRSLVESLFIAGHAVVGGVVVAGAVLTAGQAHAVAKAWNSASDSTWNIANNWTPPGVPATADDVTLGSVLGTFGTRTTMDVSDAISTLTMLNGNDLDTSDFELIVNGAATLSGSGTSLLIKPNNNGVSDSFDADALTVQSSAFLQMLGGRLEVDGSTGSGQLNVNGATMTGYGFIDLEDAGAGDKFILSNATLNVGNTSDGIIIVIGDTARTLQINATDAGATVNLDQVGSTVNLLPSATLDLNVALSDAYSSEMNLSRKSTLDIQSAWSFDGTMNINTQAGAFIGQTAGPATITGGTVTQTGGTIVLDNAADHLIIDAAFIGNGGTLASNVSGSIVEFHANATLNNGFTYQLGLNNTTVIDGATVTVNDDDFNMDGDGASDWRLINGARLNTRGDNIDTGGTDTYGGTITFGGSGANVLDINVLDNAAEISTVVVEAGAQGEITSVANDNIAIQGTVTVNAGGTLFLDSNSITFQNSGSLTGAGTVIFDDVVIVADDTTFSVTNLDIDNLNGSLTVNSGATLDITSSSIEQVNTVFLLNSATANVTPSYSYGSGGELRYFELGANNPIYNGSGTATFLSGSLITNGSDGAQFNSDAVFNEGAIIRNTAAGSILVLGDGGKTITLAGGDIEQLVAGSEVQPEGTLEVTGASNVTVTTFDWDQATTIARAGGNLDINVTNIDNGDDNHDATIEFDGGIINVDTAANSWTSRGLIRSTGGGSLFGDRVLIGDDTGSQDAEVQVNAGSFNIGAPASFFSDAEVTVAAGATLTINNSGTLFAPVNAAENGTFTGAGTLRVVGATFSEATTFDMTGGTVALDGTLSGNGGLFVLTAGDNDINAALTINAAVMEDYGQTTVVPFASASELHISNTGSLTVNLDNPNDEWTVLSNGIINYTGDATTGTIIAGSDVNLNGTLNVTGDGQILARVDITGTINIQTVNEDLSLFGGSFADPNTISSGTINGPGFLSATTGDALHGNGFINADIDFNGTARLIAQDGLLDINGTLIDVGRIGTLDTGPDPVLDIAAAWNTNVAQEVLLQGGRIQGGTITNDLPDGINGFGQVIAAVVNNTRIDAEGGTLTIQNNATNWDGSTNAGQLNALTGDLTLVDNAAFLFQGSVNANNGRTVLASGFELEFEPTASLTLFGGTYRSTHATDFGGSITTNTATSTIQIPGTAVIESTANVTLNTNLVIDNANTVVQSGAAFSGAGRLVNPSGSTLTALNLANVGVLLENNGTLVIGSSPGRLDATDYIQGASGDWEVEVGGTGLGQFDRFLIGGNADLSGNIDLSLIGGYVPAMLDSVTVMNTAGLIGIFDTVSGINYAPGMGLAVTYTPTNVLVTATLLGDTDLDGDVDDFDLINAIVGYTGSGTTGSSWAAGDTDGDGDTDDFDLINMIVGYTGSLSSPATSTVPEPGGLALLGLGGLLLARRRRSA